MHRNVKSDALLFYAGHETGASTTDVFGFGYGKGPITLIVRYDTRVRIVASYGCSIKLGLDEAHAADNNFVWGGVSIDVMPDCGPGSWIDVIPEDWRLFESGKKRLRWDASCGDIPLCGDPPPPPNPKTPPVVPPSEPANVLPRPPPYVAALEPIPQMPLPRTHTHGTDSTLRMCFLTGSRQGEKICRRVCHHSPRLQTRRRTRATGSC
jgi:hypothetical protein